MILTVDIGNSRIKGALWQEDVIVDRAAVAYVVNNSADAFAALFSAMNRLSGELPSQVFAVCAAGKKPRQSLSAWVKLHWQLDVEYLKTEKQYYNIINGYQDPGQHGADRWASVVASHQIYPDSAVCVIGAGTAITFDLMNKNGRHLGGYILPSFSTMHAALLADTANVVSESDPSLKICGVPDNTSDAVNQGLSKLLQAGIRDLCQHAIDELGLPMQIIVTGGFAPTILNYPDMPVMRYEPDLVMQGLYNMMAQRRLDTDT